MLDFNEADDAHGIAREASERKFFVDAQYESGVSIPIQHVEDMPMALPMIRQAHATDGLGAEQ